jgi:hypothetical protein
VLGRVLPNSGQRLLYVPIRPTRDRGDANCSLTPVQRYVSAPSTSDLRDAGHEVLVFGVLSEETPACPDADAHPRCERLLLRRSA